MNMKKLSVAVMVMLGTSISAANASDGTLNFAGSVASGTCSVASNSKALAVDFSAVTTSTIRSLNESGATSPELQKEISINLVGCPASASTAKINFEGLVSSYNSNIFGSTNPAAAKYLGAIIKDKAGNVITANSFDGEFNSKEITAGNNTLTYMIGLARTTYTTNPTTGVIDIPVTYTLSYQ